MYLSASGVFGIYRVVLVLASLLPTGVYAGSFKPGDIFQLAIEKQAGSFIEKRVITEDVDAFVYETRSYLVWKQGPKAGRIYQVLEKPKHKQFIPRPIREFTDKLNTYIDEYSCPINKSEESDYALLKESSHFIYHYFEGKFGDYFLREAQYYDFPSTEQKQLIRLFIEIQNLGISEYVQGQAQQRLAGCTHQDKIQNVNPSLPTDVPWEKRILFTEIDFIDYGKHSYLEKADEHHRTHLKEPLYLTHGTYSQKLPNIIQLKGIASADYVGDLGINRTSGGEHGRHGAPSHSAFVSFWWGPQGNAKLRLGYGDKNSFEYPISFGVGKRNYENIRCYNSWKAGLEDKDEKTLWAIEAEQGRTHQRGEGGRWWIMHQPGGGEGLEGRIYRFWPIECIDYVFVPPFAVQEVGKVLLDWQIGNIKVIPYSQDLLTPL